MCTFLKAALLTAYAVTVVACGRSGSPFDRALDHAEKIVSLLESNKDDAEKAATAVETYVANSKAAFETLRTDIKRQDDASFDTLLNSSQHTDALTAMQNTHAAVRERSQLLDGRLSELYQEHPNLLDHDRIRTAMAEFRAAVAGMSFVLILEDRKPALDRAFDHAEKLVALIEANKTDGAKAADAVEKYVADNKLVLDAMKADVQTFTSKMWEEASAAGEDEDKNAAIKKKYRPIFEKIEKRYNALQVYMEKLEAAHPGLKDNARIDAVMVNLFGRPLTDRSP